MADRETVLLEVINTKHKKNGGVLRLLSNTLAWIPHGSDSPKLSCAYSEIKGKARFHMVYGRLFPQTFRSHNDKSFHCLDG